MNMNMPINNKELSKFKRADSKNEEYDNYNYNNYKEEDENIQWDVIDVKEFEYSKVKFEALPGETAKEVRGDLNFNCENEGGVPFI